jgi:hypothetical protein
LKRNFHFEKHGTKKSVFFIALSIVFLFWQYSQMWETFVRFLDRNGELHVFSLPVKDKKRLLCFMRTLFAEDNFAYTLLGSKPLSWVSYKKPFPFSGFSTFWDSFRKYHSNLRQGWETWSKYSHLFPTTAFWAESPSCHPGWNSILIVNEEKFNDVVNNHKEDFQNVLHRETVDGFQLLGEAKNQSLMDEVLKGHQALIGIVLGYGRNNSWEFMKRSEKRNPLCCVWDELDDRKPREIRTRIGAIDIADCLFLQSCPSFAGNPRSGESLTLKREYLLTKQKVINYYKDKDFLEATLSLLAGYRPE